MIKTLIVEDEILARLGLRQLVDWRELGFQLLEDAKDGSEALQTIEQEHPQLMLLDINIPEINGLQLLEQLRERGIRCATIVISCDNDLNTVKQAMKLGATDYFHKMNLSPKELAQLLSKVKADIEKLGSEALPGGRQAVDELAYEDLLNGAGRRILDERYQHGFAISIHAPHTTRGDLAMIDRQCRGLLMERQGGAAVATRDGLLYLVCAGQADDTLPAEWWRLLSAAVVGPLYLGVSSPWSDFTDRKEALFLAEQVKTLAFYEEAPGVYSCAEKLGWREKLDFSLHDVCAGIVQCLDSWERPGVCRLVADSLNDLQRHRYLRIPMLQRIFMDLLSIFSARAQALGGTIEEIQLDGQVDHFNRILRFTAFRQVKEWFMQFITEFFAVFSIREKCSHSDLLQKTLSFVEKNLYSVIRLSQMSREIGVSEAYLSSMFHREMGETLINYVNRRKVEEAKHLLAAGKLVYEVSESMGFEYTTYFSKLFKRYEGETPDAFRKRHQPDREPI